MDDETREARAEQRAITRRADRIRIVLGALHTSTRKTTRQIASETGFSEPLVLSTLNLIRRQTDDREGSAVAYDPSRHEWWIPSTWDEHKRGIEWLRQHLSTRIGSLSEFLDVAAATWPTDVPMHLRLGIMQISAAMEALEQAITYAEANGGASATRPPKLYG